MTDKQRIEILEKAKQRITDRSSIFICEAIAYFFEKGTHRKVFRNFPELEKHKPESVPIYSAWFWGDKARISRLKVLNKVIKEIKSNSND